jgi:hypothetical protein
MEINFNTDFYNLNAVAEGVEAYGDLADFVIKKDNNAVTVELSDIDSDVKDVIEDEFSNYVLACMEELRNG